MRIVTARRTSQIFFFALFLWFCIVSTLGTAWHELRGWPVNWLLELDPLVGLATLLSTGTLYRGLLWGLLTILLTLVFGRFFCGWLCPFGSLHQFVGWLGRRRFKRIQKIRLNRYRHAQRLKYYLLFALLAACAAGLIGRGPAFDALRRGTAASLQTGLLDPIPLLHRSVNLVWLPLADRFSLALSVEPRHYQGATLIGTLFLGFVLLNLAIPRFYCRFLCPLGALFGLLNRWSLFRVAKVRATCSNCNLCAVDCEGACEPEGKIRWSECLLCMNCIPACPDGDLRYRAPVSEAGEIPSPELSRRGFLLSLGAGLLAPPLLRAGGLTGNNWPHRLLRPPGSLGEEDFLARCIKCGQCMRVCPTNIIQPALLEGGLEALWTPVLNYRVGSSGCELNCVACGHLCPTGAIRPLALAEKHGRGDYADQGPVRIGTAFVDRGRCLPWAMNKPCIVCEENCPVSPKAIQAVDAYEPVYSFGHTVAAADGPLLRLDHARLEPGRLGAGDFHCQSPSGRHRIVWNSDNAIQLEPSAAPLPRPGERIEILIHLQRPMVDPDLCIGCGICEHECPVSGLRAIRVTAENETRQPNHRLS